MKISLKWLKDYIAPGISAEKLAHKLTMAGMEVEHISRVGSDTVFEIEVTPNRSDCLNIIGIAREVGAILKKNYTLPKSSPLKYPKTPCDIKIEDKKGCTRYIGTVIKNVRVTKTPLWIEQRITVLGARSVNNIVDITNFALMETGQPLHAFDYDRLAGGKIIVRRAKKGEKIVTIDDVERELDPSILVIADEKRPVAIAGVMGGKDTEVTSATNNILLESAYFDPVLIRQAARKLGLSSDSSYRFERGVDYNAVATGSKRAVALIVSVAKGFVERHSDVAVSKQTVVGKPITVSLYEINNYIGLSLKAAQCIDILKKLGFAVLKSKKDVLKTIPPSFRTDVKEPVDIVEEIARIVGYDNVPLSLPAIKASDILPDRTRDFRKIVCDTFLANGFNEVITYSMVNQASLDRSHQGSLQGIKIKNPLTQDQELMRPSLLPSLLSIVKGNINRGQKDIKFFEIGKNYVPGGEQETLGVIATGLPIKDWRKAKEQSIDFYDMKGVLEVVFGSLQLDGIRFTLNELSFLEAGQRASIFIDNVKVGALGKMNEDILARWDIKQADVYFAQVNLEEVYSCARREKRFEPVSEYPAIVRDLSIAVKKDVPFKQVQDVATELGAGILTSITFAEEYLGDKIPEGHRGLVFSLNYQSSKRTLREEEVNEVHENIAQTLTERLGATRR